MAERKKVQRVNIYKPSVKTKNKPAAKHSKNVSHTDDKILMSPDHSENLKKNKKNTNARISDKSKNQKAKITKTENVSHNYSKTDKFPRPVRAMYSNRKKQYGPNLSIVMGKKRQKQRKRLITLLLSFVAVVSLVLFCVLTPTGPVEAVTNTFALIGKGSFPASVSGSGIKSLKTSNNKVYLLTSSHISAYTSNGKQLLDIQHDYSNPSLAVSKERCLVYNRESTGYMIANNSGQIYKKDLKTPIYTADIADDGSVAFVTKSTGYSAEVQVYSKSLNKKFSWYCVNGLISAVALSPDGSMAAVSELKVSNGSYTSVVYCFKLTSQTPLFTQEFAGQSVIDLKTVSKNVFACITNQKVSFINWKTGLLEDSETSNAAPGFFKKNLDSVIAVFGKTGSSVVALYNSQGIKQNQFEYNGLIDDITFSNENVYILKNNNITVLDKSGKEKTSIPTEQNPVFISAGKAGVFSVDNTALTFYKNS